MVAELSRKLLREIDAGNETREGRLKRLEFVRASSQILDLSFEAAVMAGELDVDREVWHCYAPFLRRNTGYASQL